MKKADIKCGNRYYHDLRGGERLIREVVEITNVPGYGSIIRYQLVNGNGGLHDKVYQAQLETFAKWAHGQSSR